MSVEQLRKRVAALETKAAQTQAMLVEFSGATVKKSLADNAVMAAMRARIDALEAQNCELLKLLRERTDQVAGEIGMKPEAPRPALRIVHGGAAGEIEK